MILCFSGTGNSRYVADRIARLTDDSVTDVNVLIRQGNMNGSIGDGHLVIVNPAFYALFVKAKAFRATDSCVGCGRCVSLCPMNNIRLEGARPVWGKDCTHCMACICRCPKAAIEYGKKSVGKPRYHCIPERNGGTRDRL